MHKLFVGFWWNIVRTLEQSVLSDMHFLLIYYSRETEIGRILHFKDNLL